MLVEDRLAFVEPLQVAKEDKRAAKLKLRAANARLQLLEAQFEIRMFEEGLERAERALAVGNGVSERAKREVGRGRGHLEKMRRVEAARRARYEAIENEAQERAARSKKVTTYRLHSGKHHVDCSARQFVDLSDSQRLTPVCVATIDGKRWWWYLDRFWWDEGGLSTAEIKTVVANFDLAKQQRREAIRRAEYDVLGGVAWTRVREPITEAVRDEVWRRDLGRCVDCGTNANVALAYIIPASEGGSRATSNIELRCESCDSRRRHNEARAGVSRARFFAGAAQEWGAELSELDARRVTL